MRIINFFRELGLTEYEAKALEAMINLKKASAIEVSKETRIPKTRVYDILNGLANKKLIVRLTGKPKSYQIISPEIIFNTLLEREKRRLERLNEEAKQFLKTLSKPMDKEKVIKIKHKDEFFEILSEELKKAKKSIEGFASLEKGYEKILPIFRKHKEKDVSIRLLYNPSHMQTVKAFQQEGIPMKAVSTKLEGFLIDNSTVILPLNNFSQENAEYHIGIWSNSPIAKVLKHYFEKHW